MILTKAQIIRILPKNKNPGELVRIFNILFPKYGVATPNRVAGFLAQCGHESLEFTVLKENLNYSSQGLLTVFKKYFPDLTTANSYSRQPEKIANRVYANRMGNGPESSGDGYRYRGRGAIQLTGKNNYTKFAESIGKTLPETIAYLETLEGAIESALWFWKTNNINVLCDADDLIGMTKRINGGTHGLQSRSELYKKALSIL